VLIAHEVAHTVQQAGGRDHAQYKLAVSSPGDAAEVEADRAADAMVAGAPASIGGAAAGAVQRQPDGAPPTKAPASEGTDAAEAPTGEGQEAPPEISSARQAMISEAQALVGTVHAGELVDEDGAKVRRGWETLKMIWDTAFGGHYKDQEILRAPRKGQKLKHGSKQNAEGKYDASSFEQVNDVLGSWCGIFPTAMGKRAGLPIPDWGAGGAGGVVALPTTMQPKPGDVVNKTDRNHFGIIKTVDPLPDQPTIAKLKAVNITTIEGNTDGGQILEKASTIGAWDAGGYGVRDLEGAPKAKKK
jgi:hypothetical protein